MSRPIDRLNLPPQLAATAVPVNELGVDEVGWSRADALRVLDALAGRPIAVLGGDVIERADRLRYANANWHTDQQSDEAFPTYAARSQQNAREYIQRYPRTSAEPLFVLVCRGSDISQRSPNER